MSLATYTDYTSPKLGDMTAPLTLACSDVSIVVPVKDNQAGVERFLGALFATHDTATFPREVVIVDNASAVPVRIPERFNGLGVPVRLLHCARPGPASARNVGAAAATRDWLLFADSDCSPTSTFITGYMQTMSGAVGYAGSVRAGGGGRLSRYYESQSILVPPKGAHDRPLHLVTANALVWRPAFQASGGFDERFPDAAGEAVDLGLRLRQFGTLAYAPASVVVHDFGKGVVPFVQRFVRYGRGNRRLAVSRGIDLAPRPFAPAVPTAFNWCAAILQYLLLLVGYFVPMWSTTDRQIWLRTSTIISPFNVFPQTPYAQTRRR